MFPLKMKKNHLMGLRHQCSDHWAARLTTIYPLCYTLYNDTATLPTQQTIHTCHCLPSV